MMARQKAMIQINQKRMEVNRGKMMAKLDAHYERMMARMDFQLEKVEALCNWESHHFYWTGHVECIGYMINAYISSEGPGCRCVIDLKEKGCDRMDWIRLAVIDTLHNN
jgi:hypothetical protein